MSGLLRVLMYHRVAEGREASTSPPSVISATPAVFARQMAQLARAYRPVAIHDVLEASAGGRPLPRRAVLVTFDDGYRDFADVAWPILRAAGIRPVLFVSTAYPGQQRRKFWWDRVYRAVMSTNARELCLSRVPRIPLDTPLERATAFRSLRSHVESLGHDEGMAAVEDICARLALDDEGLPSLLDWETLRDIRRDGVDVGAHTRTHPLLTRLAPSLARAEIAGSLADVRRELDTSLPIFCYPAGAHDRAVTAAVADCGVELAFGVSDGHNDLARSDRLRLRRIGVTRRTGVAILRARLTRAGALVDRWRHRALNRDTPAAPRPSVESAHDACA